MSKLGLLITIMVVVFCAVTIIASPVQTATVLTILHSFDGTDGRAPVAGLVQGLNGKFYGTTNLGADTGCPSGGDGCGTVFNISAGGALTTLHRFDGPDGAFPTTGLIQSTNGNLYGTTSADGEGPGASYGTVFKITAGGALTTLHTFHGVGADGIAPSELVQATGGNFYGTTYAGGANNDGTVFKITAGGALTTLYNFDVTDGHHPSGLVRGSDGNFYGTTYSGGTNDDGTVFKITPAGTLTTLYSFCSKPNCTDGQNPAVALVRGSDGNFYGTTKFGGARSNGTMFKVTPAGGLTTLHTFDGTHGSEPLGLVQGSDGNFYGITRSGGVGSNHFGTVFEITPAGIFTFLRSFGANGGVYPEGTLMQATNGNFYGTASEGGANGYGTVYRLSVGLGPFVETLPTSGKVGATIRILGNNLMDATSVTFNGVAATFTAVTNSEITATVPSGATSGPVQVVMPNTTLSSNMPFRVP